MRHGVCAIAVSDRALTFFTAGASDRRIDVAVFADEIIECWLADEKKRGKPFFAKEEITMPHPRSAFVIALTAARKNAQLANRRLARAVNMPYGTLTNIIHGGRRPSAENHAKLVAYFPELAAVKCDIAGSYTKSPMAERTIHNYVEAVEALDKPGLTWQESAIERRRINELEKLEKTLVVDERDEATLIGTAVRLLAKCSRDELAVVVDMVERIDSGRQAYGALDLRNDNRDWEREIHEERLDAMIYRSMQRRAAALRGV
jgi:hypothetical protein